MQGIHLPEIRPIKDLRNTNEISKLCHDQKEPIYITKNGYNIYLLRVWKATEKS